MKYLLTVLTNGRRKCLDRTLDAFTQMVKPEPADIFVFDDGGRSGNPGVGRYSASGLPLGMCSAHARCWQEAAASEYEWVFHLEDDYVILRPTDLTDLCLLMHVRPDLQQVALVRTPWGREVEYGGYIAQEPSWYERKTTEGIKWIYTRRNWTATPALFRTSLTRHVSWSEDPNCEGEIGFRILDGLPASYGFGLWGWGEAWAAHIGVERAKGAHGY